MLLKKVSFFIKNLKVQRTKTTNFNISVRCTYLDNLNIKFYKYFAALLLFIRKPYQNS
jgi:hypothetical protein